MPWLSKLSHFFSCWRNFSSSLLPLGAAQAEMIIAVIIRTAINAFFIINLNNIIVQKRMESKLNVRILCFFVASIDFVKTPDSCNNHY